MDVVTNLVVAPTRFDTNAFQPGVQSIPAPNVRVQTEGAGTCDSERTGADGTCKIELDSKQHAVTASPCLPHAAPLPVLVGPNDTAVTIRLIYGSFVGGRVLDALGNPAQARVEVRWRLGTTVASADVRAWSSGSFFADVPEDAVDVRVQARRAHPEPYIYSPEVLVRSPIV